MKNDITFSVKVNESLTFECTQDKEVRIIFDRDSKEPGAREEVYTFNVWKEKVGGICPWLCVQALIQQVVLEQRFPEFARKLQSSAQIPTQHITADFSHAEDRLVMSTVQDGKIMDQSELKPRSVEWWNEVCKQNPFIPHLSSNPDDQNPNS